MRAILSTLLTLFFVFHSDVQLIREIGFEPYYRNEQATLERRGDQICGSDIGCEYIIDSYKSTVAGTWEVLQTPYFEVILGSESSTVRWPSGKVIVYLKYPKV